MLLGSLLAAARPHGQRWKPDIPNVWDEAALADWATPLAGLNRRPTHISAKEYYSLRVESLRTYPVYFPGREPSGYWEMLQRIGPKPLIEPKELQTEADWIEAGRRVFDEADHLHLRTFDPSFVAAARSVDTYKQAGVEPLPDGTVFGSRWVPTEHGVALSFGNCNNCHLLYKSDGTRVPGAPSFAETSQTRNPKYRNPTIIPVQFANHVVIGAAPFRMGDEPIGMWLYRAYGVPWRQDDVHERAKAIEKPEYEALVAMIVRGGGVPRWSGSLFYPAKMPDLIGIKDRRYIDHTGTHLHRGIGDLMRYAALISFADAADYGQHHLLGESTRRVQARLSDEALFALALYLYSLEPPPNPNPVDERTGAGQKIFAREGMSQVPHSAAVHQQQADARAGIRCPVGRAGKPGHPPIVGGNGSGACPHDAEGHRLLQGSFAQRRVVPGALPARRIGGEPRRDVRPGPAEGHACAGRLEAARFSDSRDQRS